MDGMIIDNFAGGGGASLGIERALGAKIDVAINHDPVALGVHAANHPDTVHMVEDVFDIDPLEVTKGRPVRLAWFSPDCRHHSKAKGGRPVSKQVRALAWVVLRWARRVRPAVIALENVEEFQHWGPLEGDKPCKVRRGETFNLFIARLRQAGYKVEWKELRACDYGAPTVRKRLFLIARCDGLPICWPEPSHAAPEDPRVIAGKLKPYRTAGEIIDWSLPCPSIFLTKEQGRALGIKRPLAEKTMTRIARGLVRYVLQAQKPFILGVAHGEGQGRGKAEWSISEPLRTVTGSRDHAIVTPYVTKFQSNSVGSSMEEPIATVTANSFKKRPGCAAPLGVVAPYLVPRYGERDGQDPRALSVEDPSPTIVPAGNGASLVSAFLAKHYGDKGQRPGSDLFDPVSTVTATDHNALVAANMISLKGQERRDSSCDAPLPALCAQGNHAGLVAAFLTKYHRDGGQHQCLFEPLHTVDTGDRFGLVTVTIGGEEWVIVDIGMRMLTPRERARAQGFPDSYVLDWQADGTPVTKTSQGRLIGNSVCPDLGEAIVAANCGEAAAAPVEEEGSAA